MKSSEIIGNESVLAALRGALKNNSLSHAYLILGRPHIGKDTIVRAFLRDLFHNDEQQAMQIEKGIHPDVLIVRRQEGDTKIKIEQIQQARQHAMVSTGSKSYRVIYIQEVDALSIGAANALLKMLEEPPKQVLFFLTAKSAQSVLPTIRSRCVGLRCRPVGIQTLTAALCKQGMAAEDAVRKAREARGCPGSALHDSAAENPVALLHEPLYRRLQFIEEYIGKGDDSAERSQELLATWQVLFRDMISSLTGNGAHMVFSGYAQEVAAYAEQKGLPGVVSVLEVLVAAQKKMATNVNKKLLLETIALKF